MQQLTLEMHAVTVHGDCRWLEGSAPTCSTGQHCQLSLPHGAHTLVPALDDPPCMGASDELSVMSTSCVAICSSTAHPCPAQS